MVMIFFPNHDGSKTLDFWKQLYKAAFGKVTSSAWTSHPKTRVFSFQTCYRGSLYLEYNQHHNVQYLVISKKDKGS